MGESDWRSSYERDTFVEDVWGVVTATKMEKPIVVGHSFGGMVSLITAGKYSSFMKGLLLVDFVVYPSEEHAEWFAHQPKSRPPQMRDHKEDFSRRFRLMPDQECANQFLIDFIADKGSGQGVLVNTRLLFSPAPHVEPSFLFNKIFFVAPLKS